jgi:hypothetical protein
MERNEEDDQERIPELEITKNRGVIRIHTNGSVTGRFRTRPKNSTPEYFETHESR